ncbi:MAG: phosphatidylglycerol lysyltransferase domain-containing protein [Oscillospiraceae bacterium]|nr:phosphatidylglycerol lysyltransferase domain-containing protein [Oscillospiraceae bacterium]
MNESCCCTICSEQAAGADAPAGFPSIGAVNIEPDYEPNVNVLNMPVEPLLATDAPDIDITSLDFGPFKQVELSDKAVFDRHFMALNPQISDLTFSNLFMWRNMINFRVAWFGGFACILAIPRAYPPYLYAPVGDVAGDPAGFSGAVVQCCDFFRANGWQPRFRCVPIDVVPALTRLFKSCECEEDRDFYDYLYLASDLIELRGKKYDGKRNHIKRFTRQYEYEYVKMSPAHIDDCLRIMYDRCVENDCDCLRGVEYACDRQPSAELLLHFEALDCRGALISVDGRFEAFTVGEALNRDTAVIYIEKANTAITGIYTFINRQFAEQEWSSMTYINREEDEGVPGLRKAKLSYHPVKLIEKYTVTCK